MIRIILIVAFLACSTVYSAERSCISKIERRILEIGDYEKINIAKLWYDIREVDIADIKRTKTSPSRKSAYDNMWLYLSGFVEDSGTHISAEGIRGALKVTACLINPDGHDTVAHLRNAFTKGGAFMGSDFDKVMSKLGDTSKFDFDPVTKSFVSKVSGIKYEKRHYGVGERHAIPHILRQHLDNDSVSGKSKFTDPDAVLELIDDAWMSTNKVQSVTNPSSWTVDLAPRTTGLDVSGNITTKLQLFMDGNSIRTAYPL